MKLYTTTEGGKKHILQREATFNGSELLYAFCALGTTNADWTVIEEVDFTKTDKSKICKTCLKKYEGSPQWWNDLSDEERERILGGEK